VLVLVLWLVPPSRLTEESLSAGMSPPLLVPQVLLAHQERWNRPVPLLPQARLPRLAAGTYCLKSSALSKLSSLIFLCQYEIAKI
jgi:hypothetical protein